jgi:hypothetical protein
MPAATEVSEEWVEAEARLCRHCADEKSSCYTEATKGLTRIVGKPRRRWRCSSVFLPLHHDLRPPTPRRAYFRETIRRVHIAPPAALSVASIVVASVALLKYGVLSACLKIWRNILQVAAVSFDAFLAF